MSIRLVTLPPIVGATPSPKKPEAEKPAGSSMAARASGSSSTTQDSGAQSRATETPQDAPVAPALSPFASAASQPTRASAQSVVAGQIDTAADVDTMAANDATILDDAARALPENYGADARDQAVIAMIAKPVEVMEFRSAKVPE